MSTSSTALPPDAAGQPSWQVGYGTDLDVLAAPAWRRPPDWLPLPAITTGEQKMAGLFAVFPGAGNVLALRAAGDYTVDWGDGTVEHISSPAEVIHRRNQWVGRTFYNITIGPGQRIRLAGPQDPVWLQRIESSLRAYHNGNLLDPSSYALELNGSSNAIELVITTQLPDYGWYQSISVGWDWLETLIEPIRAEHQYRYDALPASSHCSRGYRQVIVTVTPQSGAELSQLDLNPRHSNISEEDASCPWLDLRLSLPRAASGASIQLANDNTYEYLGSLECLEILDAGGATSFYALLSYAVSLRRFRLQRAAALQDIESMLSWCSSLCELELPPLPLVSSASSCFLNCTALRELRLQGMAALEDISGMLSNCVSLRELRLDGLRSLPTLSNLLADCRALERVWIEDAPSLRSTAELFAGCVNLRQVVLSGATAITGMEGMFRGCSSLVIAPPLVTSAVESMSAMFMDCWSLQVLPHYDTAAVTSMAGMFGNCRSLQTIPLFDTSAVTTMEEMFMGCYALARLPLLDTRALESMEGMFGNCWALPLLPPLNTSALRTMQSAFAGCYALLQLPPLDVAAVESFDNAFSNCVVLAAAPLQGAAQELSLWGCALDRPALLELFSALAEVSDGQSLDIGSNPGLAELTEADRAIATAKGWTLLS